MKSIVGILGVCLLVHMVAAPPPRRNEVDDKKHDSANNKEEVVDDFGLEYNRYLKEVIDLLESDPEFKKKLEDAQEADIRSGLIAKELEFVDHKVRTKLDEAKRQEIERLRHLAQKQYELSNGIETEHVKVSSEHLDHHNPHTFEMEDLKKLIAKVSQDLNEADEKRRQEFKEYEMQKEYEKQQKLQHLEGSEKEAFEKQLKENETKHKQHEPLHHPGSKQQLEEVWEKQDHMNQDFDPKIFFQLHDLDGNGFWDHNEVKTLFLKELDKMYEAGAPEDDMKERVEEMERMREHVFSEADKNKDGLISYEEFIDKTKQPDFEKDSGWETLDQKPVYTPEEYREFERRRQEEVERMIQQGLIPPQPVFHPQPGYHPQIQYAQYHPPQYQGQGYPQQPSYRYAHDFPNQQVQGGIHLNHAQQPQGGYHQVQGGIHLNHAQQQRGGGMSQVPSYPHPGVVNQQYQDPHAQQGQEHHQGYQQQQEHQNPPTQNHPKPPQQEHQNQQEGYQQPQGHQNQQQGYQQPQGHQNQQQGYQQPQVHQNQQQGYHQPSQAYQHPPANNQQNQLPLTNTNQGHGDEIHQQNQQPQGGYQPGHDPNEIHPINPEQSDLKHGKSEGVNSHNAINVQQKKTEQNNDHQSKFSNQ